MSLCCLSVSQARRFHACVGFPYNMEHTTQNGLCCATSRETTNRRRESVILQKKFFPPQHAYAYSDARPQKNYYDVLNVTPKATNAQVKEAYYKLSMRYHPDQYKGSEDAAIKFREITEAYNVLANYEKRRLYDKGIYGSQLSSTPAEAEDYAKKFYDKRSKRKDRPVTTGRTPIYDFDEWMKAHYTSSFTRRTLEKERYENMKMRKIMNQREKKESVFAIAVFSIVVLASYLVRWDYDKVQMPLL